MTSTTTVTPAPVQTRGRGSGLFRRGKNDAGGGQGQATPLARGVVWLICFLWIVPIIGVVITSFRPKDDANTNGWWNVFTDPNFTFDNFQQAWSKSGLGDAFINSFAIALPATLIPIMVAAFAAYAFTFMQFPFRDTLFFLIVALLVVPNYVAFVPLLQLYGQFDMVGTFPAVWLAHIGFGMSLAIYILRNFMSTLPKEVIESAKIDGASHFVTFWRLIVPMSVPALASFAIFQFLWVWNDLLTALVFIGPTENQPITIAVAGLLGQQNQGWQLVTAGGLLSMIVPVIVFLSLQRYFVRGLTAGSVKG
ncbi:MAG TPA: carbohydrate ABC transporter permease [Kineosporiaceae bacterium]|nr:carbohydrate ABC transporter permease [Kineosporiaceae bacterium]